MAGHNDPRLLYSIPNIKAYHIQDGDESSLTPSGPQTLSLLMVPTSSPFADPSTSQQKEAPEQDFYLHLHLPPELDLPLPATTQIYHQPPSSYLLPRWDLGAESGAFTRIEFPSIGPGKNQVTQDDIDTFETILAQCTAFLERSGALPQGEPLPAYNPADYAPGEGYAGSHTYEGHAGQIVLIDEENGSVVGELSDGFKVVEDPNLKVGSKNPVEIQLPAEGNEIDVRPVSEEYLKLARHPAYKDSLIVSNAATASRLIVTGSSYLSGILTSGAESFTKKVKSNPQPMTFTPTTHARVRKLHNFSQGAAGLSAKTIGQIGKYAQNFGASMARKGEKEAKDTKPGMLNKSMIAFSTIMDGVDQAGRQLLASSSSAATTVVGHRYGEDARSLAADIAGGAKNVGLVYIDAAGVSRRAVIKSVAKGMVVGKVRGGGELIVGGGDGGVIPAADQKRAIESASNQAPPGSKTG
ncbi:hypothetical protein L228DRAFT_239027 [Xylona heveae TC161]|uniref:Senescence domain-containing protein n=1 Tax=Xylona heveae (strain CBS 132557 / TC161) TaxID=1328760 RepID=A0A165GBU0_XYLHT|nr:hypothetical protein L228DRAFT_239027 [Xylona heveae TC161]KZF21999.1 hypothetical protein L228DRAFT_239027 [Xylona heveae TC161]